MTDYAVGSTTPRRLGPPAACWGMLMLIASEGMLFAAFIASYYYERFTTVVWPPVGDPEPRLVVPLVLTFVLAGTSAPMYLASRAARAGRLGATRLFVGAALIVQSGYFAYQANDFGDQIRRFDITHDTYSSIYYTLLGADHAHVFLGLLFDLWLLLKLTRGLTTYRVNAAQAIAWYWFAVSAITLAVTGTLLSARV